jgi:hypothetical protein
VLGGFLAPPGPARIGFDVVIPARYAIVADAAGCAGALDGTPYRGPRHLEPGRHEFQTATAGPHLALVWARALRRGFSPFAVAETCG